MAVRLPPDRLRRPRLRAAAARERCRSQTSSRVRGTSFAVGGTTLECQLRAALNCRDFTTWKDFRSQTSQGARRAARALCRSEEHTSELQSRGHLVCRLLLEKKKK